MMTHYLETKKQYPDCILFYRLGDFYEMFFEDAKTVSRELELTLTGKDCGLEERAPMCGVPFHAVEGYLTRLVQKGYKVAIAEQMDWGRLFDVSVGSFRVSQDYLKKMRKNAPDSAVVQFPYENDRGVYHYGDGLTREMEGFLVERLSQYLPEEKIFLWEKEET